MLDSSAIRRSRVRAFRLALWLSLICAGNLVLPGLSPVQAEGVSIDAVRPAESLVIRVDGASIASVLHALHDKFSIEISAAEDALPTEPLSISLNGDLHTILQRLLRNQNYMIVRSQSNVTGVEKIVILAASPKPPKAQPESAPVSPRPLPPEP